MKTAESWKLLTETPDEEEALMIKEALESEGIACRLETQKDFPGPAHGGKAREYSIHVPLKDFETSEQILTDLAAEEDR